MLLSAPAWRLTLPLLLLRPFRATSRAPYPAKEQTRTDATGGRSPQKRAGLEERRIPRAVYREPALTGASLRPSVLAVSRVHV